MFQVFLRLLPDSIQDCRDFVPWFHHSIVVGSTSYLYYLGCDEKDYEQRIVCTLTTKVLEWESLYKNDGFVFIRLYFT